MFSGFSVFVPAMLVMIVTVLIGGITILAAWIVTMANPRPDSADVDGKVLSTFTIAVIIQIITLPIEWLIPDDWRMRVLVLLSFATFALVITSVVYLRRATSQIPLLVKSGIWTVCAANVFGFGLIIFGLRNS